MELTKIKDLTVKDFEKSPDGIEFNGVKLNSVASFYNVELETKYVIEDIQSTFDYINKKLKEKKIDMSCYMAQLNSAYKLSKALEHTFIEMNQSGDFVVKFKAKIKAEYQPSSPIVNVESQKKVEPTIN